MTRHPRRHPAPFNSYGRYTYDHAYYRPYHMSRNYSTDCDDAYSSSPNHYDHYHSSYSNCRPNCPIGTTTTTAATAMPAHSSSYAQCLGGIRHRNSPNHCRSVARSARTQPLDSRSVSSQPRYKPDKRHIADFCRPIQSPRNQRHSPVQSYMAPLRADNRKRSRSELRGDFRPRSTSPSRSRSPKRARSRSVAPVERQKRFRQEIRSGSRSQSPALSHTMSISQSCSAMDCDGSSDGNGKHKWPVRSWPPIYLENNRKSSRAMSFSPVRHKDDNAKPSDSQSLTPSRSRVTSRDGRSPSPKKTTNDSTIRHKISSPAHTYSNAYPLMPGRPLYPIQRRGSPQYERVHNGVRSRRNEPRFSRQLTNQGLDRYHSTDEMPRMTLRERRNTRSACYPVRTRYPRHQPTSYSNTYRYRKLTYNQTPIQKRRTTLRSESEKSRLRAPSFSPPNERILENYAATRETWDIPSDQTRGLTCPPPPAYTRDGVADHQNLTVETQDKANSFKNKGLKNGGDDKSEESSKISDERSPKFGRRLKRSIY